MTGSSPFKRQHLTKPLSTSAQDMGSTGKSQRGRPLKKPTPSSISKESTPSSTKSRKLSKPQRKQLRILVFDGEFRPTSHRDPRWGLCDMVIASWRKGLGTEPIETANLTRDAQDAAMDNGDFSLWREILVPVHGAILEADLIITQNGPRFDWGRLLSEFARVRLPIPGGKKFHDTLDHRFR